MIENSAEEFLMMTSRDGSFSLPSLRRHNTGAPPAPITTTPWPKHILDIAIAQQAESSLQRQAKASISSPWDTSPNQLSHIPNSIFFQVNTYVSLIFFAKYFCRIYSKYTMPCTIMIYATLDALMGHTSAATYPTLRSYGPVQMSG
jgi:hypothetical protein